MHPKADRKARIRRIRREQIEITHLRRGQYHVEIVIDGQSFRITYTARSIRNRSSANRLATEIAIALNRFKFGD